MDLSKPILPLEGKLSENRFFLFGAEFMLVFFEWQCVFWHP
jgi:hypothetical protein